MDNANTGEWNGRVLPSAYTQGIRPPAASRTVAQWSPQLISIGKPQPLPSGLIIATYAAPVYHGQDDMPARENLTTPSYSQALL